MNDNRSGAEYGDKYRQTFCVNKERETGNNSAGIFFLAHFQEWNISRKKKKKRKIELHAQFLRK